MKIDTGQLREKMKQLTAAFYQDPTNSILIGGNLIAELPKTELYYPELGEIYYQKSVSHFMQADLTLAMHCCHKAVKYLTRTGNERKIIAAETVIARIFLVNELNMEAIRHLEYILRVADAIHSEADLTQVYINMSMGFAKIGDFRKAKSLLEAAAKANEAVQDRANTGLIALGQGMLLNVRGEREKALGYCHEAMEIFESTRMADTIEVLLAIAQVHMTGKEWILADQYLKTALFMAESKQLTLSRIQILHMLGLVSLESHAGKTAVSNLTQSLTLAEEKGLQLYIIKNLKVLFNCFKRQGNQQAVTELAEKIIISTNPANENQLILANLKDMAARGMDITGTSEKELLRRHKKAVRENSRLIHMVNSIGKEIIAATDFAEASNLVFSNISKLMRIDRFTILVFDEAGQKLIIDSFIEKNQTIPDKAIELGDTHSAAAYCAHTRKILHISGGKDEIQELIPDYLPIPDTGTECNSMLYVPLEARGKLEGILAVEAYRNNQYTAREIDILSTIGSFVAILLNNMNYIEALTHKNEELKLNQKHLEFTLEDLKLANRKIEKIATFDSLTGLPNRLLLMSRLKEIISLAARYSQPFGLFFIDLDNFKIINDTLGHLAGDDALNILSQRVRRSMRKSDLLARIGGDEFIAVFDDIKQVEDLPIIARKLIEVFSQPLEMKSKIFRPGASIGISQYPDHGVTAEQLIRKADQALYQAKSSGRGQYKVFNPKTFPDGESRLQDNFFTSL